MTASLRIYANGKTAFIEKFDDLCIGYLQNPVKLLPRQITLRTHIAVFTYYFA